MDKKVPISIVILAKNEEAQIARTLSPLLDMSDDVILLDNGSTDQTIPIAQSLGARVEQIEWTGYSDTKNKGNQRTKYDWILSLDADEEIKEELKTDILNIFSTTQKPDQAWMLKRKLVYGGKTLHHGSVSNEYRIRIFNKKNASWNENEVHEDIEFAQEIKLNKLQGFLLHHSYKNQEEHLKKLRKYATLFFHQLQKKNTQIPFYKKYISPYFGFVKNYFFRFGFLDGKQGFQFALDEMKYTYWKYRSE